jgi:hypothetical protein
VAIELKRMLLKKGENTIEISILEGGVYKSTLVRHFDTNESAPVEILSIDPQLIKYSDGLHYNFMGVYNNINYVDQEV